MQNAQTPEQALQGLHRSMDALALQMRGPVVKPLPLVLVPAVGVAAAVLVTLWLLGVAQIFLSLV
ncbi:hypothetical protein [Roseateles flavus]|uniref:Uncharacterized protein n=1 Tax=Roseateles flavus TaxID=3149041 RepID=A0ABV0GG04_9BURK